MKEGEKKDSPFEDCPQEVLVNVEMILGGNIESFSIKRKSEKNIEEAYGMEKIKTFEDGLMIDLGYSFTVKKGWQSFNYILDLEGNLVVLFGSSKRWDGDQDKRESIERILLEILSSSPSSTSTAPSTAP